MGWSAGKVDDVTACRIQDGGYALLWQRYDNNKMAVIFYIFNSTVKDWTCYYFSPHSLINGTIFEEGGGNFENKTRVVISSTPFVWNISHSKKKWARYGQKFISVFM